MIWKAGQMEGCCSARNKWPGSGGCPCTRPSFPPRGKATVYDALNVHTSPNRQAPSFYQITEGVLVDVVSHRILSRGSYEPPTSDSEVFPQPSFGVSPDAPLPPGGADDWVLVRIPDGRAGWVLMRMLVMAIPDEGGPVCRREPYYFILFIGRSRRCWRDKTSLGFGPHFLQA